MTPRTGQTKSKEIHMRKIATALFAGAVALSALGTVAYAENPMVGGAAGLTFDAGQLLVLALVLPVGWLVGRSRAENGGRSSREMTSPLRLSSRGRSDSTQRRTSSEASRRHNRSFRTQPTENPTAAHKTTVRRVLSLPNRIDCSPISASPGTAAAARQSPA